MRRWQRLALLTYIVSAATGIFIGECAALGGRIAFSSDRDGGRSKSIR
jgi:hypothetical protein